MATRKIPEELLQQIFQHIDSPYGFKPQCSFAKNCERMRVRTLKNICLVSRACHRIASPILYKKFVHFAEPSWPLHQHQRSIWYLKSILSNPQNALALEHLQVRFSMLKNRDTIDRDASRDFCDLIADRTLLPEQKARLKWVVQVIVSCPDGRFGNDLGERLKREWEAAVLAMVLLLCPNITKLEMRMPESTLSGVFSSCLTSGPFPPPARAALTSGKGYKTSVTGVWQPPVLRALKEATLIDFTGITHVLLENVTGLNSFTIKDSRRSRTDTDGRFLGGLGRPVGLMKNLTYLSTRESNIWGYDSGSSFLDVLPVSLVELEICRSELDILEGSTVYQNRDWTIRHDVDLRTLALRFEYENLRRITMNYDRPDLAPQIELDEQLEERGWNLIVSDVGRHTLERTLRA